jgi:hypothetical protein
MAYTTVPKTQNLLRRELLVCAVNYALRAVVSNERIEALGIRCRRWSSEVVLTLTPKARPSEDFSSGHKIRDSRGSYMINQTGDP